MVESDQKGMVGLQNNIQNEGGVGVNNSRESDGISPPPIVQLPALPQGTVAVQSHPALRHLMAIVRRIQELQRRVDLVNQYLPPDHAHAITREMEIEIKSLRLEHDAILTRKMIP